LFCIPFVPLLMSMQCSSLNLGLSQKTLSIQKGSTAQTVTVNLIRKNMDSIVGLTATDVPAGVNVSFSPASTPGNTSTMSITATSATAVGSSTMIVTGTAPGFIASDQLALTISAGSDPNPSSEITVNGKVIDEAQQPVPGIPVKIGTTAVNTDSEGKFTIPNVKTPYDTIVVIGAVQQGYVFKALTRANPTLQVFEYKGTLKMTQVMGNLTGGSALGATNPANTYTKIFYGSPEAYNGVSLLNPGDPASYGAFNQHWANSPATTGKVYALEYKVNAQDLPIDYTGFGAQDAVLSTSSPLATVNVDMSNGVSDETLTGSVKLPTGYNLNSRRMFVKPSNDGGTQVVYEYPPNNQPFSYTTPSRSSIGLSAVTITVEAEAFTYNITGGKDRVGVWSTGLAPDTKNLALTMPEVPAQVLPTANALGVTTNTPFSFSGKIGAVYAVKFQPVAAGDPIYFVVTSGSNVQIPNLSDLGLGLPGGADYNWFVQGYAPYTSTDAASVPKGFATDSKRLDLDHPGPSADGWYALTDYRKFTTAP
jgi:hypothetical protein